MKDIHELAFWIFGVDKTTFSLFAEEVTSVHE